MTGTRYTRRGKDGAGAPLQAGQRLRIEPPFRPERRLPPGTGIFAGTAIMALLIAVAFGISRLF